MYTVYVEDTVYMCFYRHRVLKMIFIKMSGCKNLSVKENLFNVIAILVTTQLTGFVVLLGFAWLPFPLQS